MGLCSSADAKTSDDAPVAQTQADQKNAAQNGNGNGNTQTQTETKHAVNLFNLRDNLTLLRLNPSGV